MLVGVSALLLSLLVWGPLSRRHNHSDGYVSTERAGAGQPAEMSPSGPDPAR
jgi:hypothetical protein